MIFDSQTRIVSSGSEYDYDYDGSSSDDDRYSFIQESPILGDTSSIMMTKPLMNYKLWDYIKCSRGVAAFISAKTFSTLISRLICHQFNESASVLKSSFVRAFAPPRHQERHHGGCRRCQREDKQVPRRALGRLTRAARPRGEPNRPLGDFWCCDGMCEELDVKITSLPNDMLSIVLGWERIWDFVQPVVACNVVRSFRDLVRASKTAAWLRILSMKPR